MVERKGMSAIGSIEAAIKKRSLCCLPVEREWLHSLQMLSWQYVRRTLATQPLGMNGLVFLHTKPVTALGWAMYTKEYCCPLPMPPNTGEREHHAREREHHAGEQEHHAYII